MFDGKSIGQRLMVIVGTSNLIILITLIAVAMTTGAQVLQRQEQMRRVTDDALVASAMDEMLRGIRQSAADLVDIALEDPNSNPVLGASIQLALRNQNDRLIQRVVIRRSNGTIVVYEFPNPKDMTIRRSQQSNDTWPADAWFRRARPDDVLWQVQTTPYYGGSEPTLSVAQAFGDGNVLWVDVPLATFSDRLNDTLALNGFPSSIGGPYTLIYTADGQVITTHNLPEAPPEQVAGALANLWARLPSDPPSNRPAIVGYQDPLLAEASFVIQHPLSSVGWRLVTVFPDRLLPYLPAETFVALVLIAAIGSMFLMWVTYRFVRREVARPLSFIGQSAQEIGSGDLRYRIGYLGRQDEIGRLAQALEDMKQSLLHSNQQLKLWNQRLEQEVARRTAELMERTQELELARQEAHKHAMAMSAVYAESLVVVNESQLKPTLQAFTDRIVSLLNVSYCGIWLLNADKTHLQLVQTNQDIYQRLNSLIPKSQGLVGQVIMSNEAIIVDDYRTYEHRVIVDDDEYVFDQAMCVPLIVGGRAIGAVVVGRSASAARFTNDDLQILTLFANLVSPSVRNAQLLVQRDLAVQEAERANQVKTRFLASVTHELRTPLNLIINNMDFMRIGQFGEVTPEQVARLDQTIRSSEHLLYLINDLLDISKIEAGEMQLFIQPSDVYSIIDDALDEAYLFLEKLGKRGKVGLTTSIAMDLPKVPMDARRIRQVIINLLSNAIKFTDEGRVTLRVAVRDDAYIEFIVSDTGIGVPPDEMDKLFVAFERTSNAKSLNIEGTGLGLPISLYLVHQHGGEIDVKSEVGKGTVFSFTIPLHPISAQPSPRIPGKGDTQLMAALAIKTD